VCEKIEGFFDICLARGLTGRQGVIIPQANVKHLMLREVVEAAHAGQFAIYAAHHVEEAMELLTGQPAGASTPTASTRRRPSMAGYRLRLAEWIGLRQYYAGQLVKEG
jgi:predicted ATP-dependent protease